MMPPQTILLVENDSRQALLFSHMLEDMGYRVLGAGTYQEIADILRENILGLVIADYDCLEPEAFDCLKKAKANARIAEILFASENASIENAVEAMKAGALDFLIKPVTVEQVRLYADKAFCLSKDRSSTASTGSSDDVSLEKYTIVTQNVRMQRLLNLARQVADSQASVLIQGESGTGKELFARYIHQMSKRRHGPFVAVNCAALPESLLESELFGYEKGAFTGAVSKKPGKFELADGGTILLDEISEMQLHLQAKLLRVIQEREVDRVGGLKPVPVDVRVIATTNRDIRNEIQEGHFREDLYYRLNIIPLKIPALRERGDDKMLLTEHFIKKFNAIDGRNVKGLTIEARRYLERLPLKGNVRELENLIRRAVLLAGGDQIDVADMCLEDMPEEGGTGDIDTATSVPSADLTAHLTGVSLKELEQKAIMYALDQTDGNRTHAAKALGISVRTLRNKLNEYKNLETA